MRPKDGIPNRRGLDRETGSMIQPVQSLGPGQDYADGSKMNGETSGTWAFWFDAREQKSGALQLRLAYLKA